MVKTVIYLGAVGGVGVMPTFGDMSQGERL